MDLFTHKENQTILWLTIQTTPLWKPFSESYRHNTKQWFRDIMSHFYDNYRAFFTLLPMCTEDLRRINKEVVLYMIADIKHSLGMDEPAQVVEPVVEEQTISAPPTVRVIREYETLDSNWKSHPRLAEYDQAPKISPGMITTADDIHTTYNVKRSKEIREEKTKQEFDKFQQTYHTGFERKQPQQIVFSESATESRMDNSSMEDLVKRHLVEREKDMATAATAPPDVEPVSESSSSVQYAVI